jgi:hypothetical protein
MHARQIGPLNLNAKPYVRKNSQIVFVGAGYRVLRAASDLNQTPIDGPSRSLTAAALHRRLVEGLLNEVFGARDQFASTTKALYPRFSANENSIREAVGSG